MSANIQRNITTRRVAEKLMEKISENAKNPQIDAERFWELLAHYAANNAGRVLVSDTASHKMTDEEAAGFDKSIVPYGKHEGKKVGDVPVSYWPRITESTFSKDLQRYMASDYYHKRVFG